VAEDDNYNPHLEVVGYQCLRLVVRQTPLDWLVYIPLPGGPPVIVSCHDRDSALALATAWVDENVPVNGSPDAKRKD